MKELITRGQADALFNALLVLGLVAGIAAWLIARRRGANTIAAALAFGGAPLLVGLLWRVYNVIADRLGLDTVANLIANLVLFVVIGAVCGLVWGKFVVREPEEAAEEEGEPGAPSET